MKNLQFIFAFVFSGLYMTTFSQTYNLNTTGKQNVNTCSGTFYDSGGSGANYSSNESGEITFCPSTPGDKIKLDFTSFNTQATDDALSIYFGNSTAGILTGNFSGTTSPGTITSTSADGCLTLKFVSNGTTVRAGWSATISCVTTCSPPMANITGAPKLEICPSTAVTPGSYTVNFDASTSTANAPQTVSTYEWNFGDGVTTTTASPTINHTFATEGVFTVQLNVRDNNTDEDPLGCKNTNSAKQIVRILPTPNFTGTSPSSVTIVCGNSVDLTSASASRNFSEKLPFKTPFSVNLPDGAGSAYTSILDFTGFFPDNSKLTAGCYPTVTFELEHSYSGDLKIELISPSGQAVTLYNNGVGGERNFGTCANGADDKVPGCGAVYTVKNVGGVDWTAGGVTTTTTKPCAGYTGTCEAGGFLGDNSYYIGQVYNSFTPFTAINGSDLNGIWTLKITDFLASDDGTLSNWGLTFPNTCYRPLGGVTPDLTSLTWSTNSGGPTVPAQTTNTSTVTDPGPDACLNPGTCIGNKLTNDATVGPFNLLGAYDYIATTTDEFGCSYENNVTIHVSCSCFLDLISAVGTDDQTICENTALTDITYQLSGDATGATITGLPAGVNYTVVGTLITISGTPTVSGTFQYTIETIGCTPNLTFYGDITISPLSIITLSSAAGSNNQKICIDESITDITYAIGGSATGATVTGLPAGVIGSFNASVFTISGTPTGSGSSSYTVTTTGPCPSVIATGNIIVTPLPAISLNSGQNNQTVCQNAAITNIVYSVVNATGSTVSGLPTGISGSFSSGMYTLSGTPSENGTFNYTVTTVGGCNPDAIISGTIIVRPLPTASISGDNTICSGESADVNITGTPDAVIAYSVNGGASINQTLDGTGNATINTGPLTGDATYELIDAAYSGTPTCSQVINGTVTITVLPLPDATISGTSSICPGTSTNMTFTGTPNATVTYTLNGGSNQTILLDVAGNATLSTGPIPGDMNYVLVGVSSASSPSCNKALSQTATVTANPTPTTTASSNSPLCVNEDLMLSASNVTGATFSWSGPNTYASTLQNPTILGATTNEAGTYTVVATLNGCTYSSSTLVNVSTIIASDIDPAGPFCTTDSPVILTAENTSGTWSGSGITNATTGEFSPSTATIGNNVITYTIGSSCGSTSNTTIVVNTAPTTTAGSNSAICDGQDLLLTATASIGATFSWTGPNGFTASTQNSSIPAATTSATGMYTVTISKNGCSSISQVNVTVHPTPVTVAGSNGALCKGDNILLNASETIGSTYIWIGPNGYTATGPTQTVANAILKDSGTYTVTISKNGCSTSSSTDVEVNQIPSATASSNSPLCENDELQLSSNQVTGATYDWTGPNGFSANAQNPTLAVIQTTDAGDYSVIITANGCSSDPSITTVLVNPIPHTLASSNSAICADEALNLFASDITNASYSWTGPNGFVSTDQNPQISKTISNHSGTYEVTVSSNSCSSTSSTEVVVNPNPSTIAGSDSPMCEGATINLTATDFVGASYLWNGPSGFTSTTQNPIIANADPTKSGNYEVKVSVINTGCESTDNTDVIVYPIPVSDAGADISFCDGETQFIGSPSTSNYTYQWTPSSGLNNSTDAYTEVTLTNNTSTPETTNYTVTTTGPGGCTSTDEVEVTIVPTPTITFTVDKTMGCYPLTVSFSNAASPASESVVWDFGDGTTTAELGTVSHTYTKVGCYNVRLKSTSFSCSNELIMENLICLQPDAIADFYTDYQERTVLNPIFNCYNNSSNSDTYTWTFGDGSSSSELDPEHEYVDEPGTYVIKLIANNQAGCKDSIEHTVIIKDELIFYVPNTFTPDNDPYNQIFKPVLRSGMDKSTYGMTIYNRWGELIFETSEVEYGWDGSYKGNQSPDGLYVWVIQFKDSKSDKIYKYNGSVNLLR
jgi:gliding motility-associated-like protein